MSNSPYHELDKLIDEYEKDARIIKTDKLIMRNYPKVFVTSVASTFEHQIKAKCQNFIEFPLLPLSTYPSLISLKSHCSRKNIILTDSIFGKFHTFDRTNNLIQLDATEFYNLFGGATFKFKVQSIFDTELAVRIAKYEDTEIKLRLLIEIDEKYEWEYLKNDDNLSKLRGSNFASAESSFLQIKLKRNQVAHDYINGLSDTFNDLINFYLDAVLYVTSLEKAIESLTNIAALPV